MKTDPLKYMVQLRTQLDHLQIERFKNVHRYRYDNPIRLCKTSHYPLRLRCDSLKPPFCKKPPFCVAGSIRSLCYGLRGERCNWKSFWNLLSCNLLISLAGDLKEIRYFRILKVVFLNCIRSYNITIV